MFATAPARRALRLTPLAFGAALLCGLAHAAPADGAAVDAPAPAAADAPVATVVVKGEQDAGYTTRSSASSARLDLSLRETPQSVSVVTRQQMDDFRLDSVNDMLANSTGVTVERIETDRTYYTARGFDITNFQYDGVGSPFVFGNVSGELDTVLYERVDIVRGANGLMSATGNPSATVNFIRKRPTAAVKASVSATYSSWQKRRIEGDLSGALNEAGTLTGRVVAAYQKGDSYLDRYSADRKVIYGVLEAKLSRDTTLTAGHTNQTGKSNGAMWGAIPLYYTDLTPTDYDVGTSTATDWTSMRVEHNRSFVELAHRFGNGWRAQATLSRNKSETRSKLFYTYGTPDRATGLGLYAYPSIYNSDIKQTLFDASATGKFTLGGREHDLTFGANWSRSTIDDLSYYGQGIGNPLPSLAGWNGAYPEPTFDASTNGSEYEDKRKSAYVAARFSLSDPLHLITGVTTTKADSAGTAYGDSRFKSASKTTPYVGLTYDLSANVTAYGSYTAIFNPQSETDATGATLAPMEGKTAELGVKSEWFNRKLNASAAIFKTKQDNTAEQAGMIGTRAWYRGVNAESRGVELDLSGELARGLQASAGFAVLKLEDEAGNAAKTYLPRRTLRLLTTYQVPALPQLTVGASANWQDDIYRNEADGAVIRQSSYAVLGLMARYDINKQLSVSANVNNLADKKYLTSLYWSQSYYAAPRNASVTLNWKY
ncbi:TonB-dependent siderophore receptor [Pseudoduganella buxea]|uniref:Ferric-rhodotorulic acid/ferric-coprogen receptor FhuE n=1 Tax=Pseudoduganella buxea TaxID=1949069 RepID=A0A6I3SR60_9BURK|nr:TonB-dependent siderophore receptor [Pseudoduganella buxea]MTV51574.1 TonB-dependent siderophore receptor [Pseudoduganella buxea]GGB90132.1 ferric-rhodotorulic acid/ferric-coprogen receptor FhuE [Pseudoduganella buxea]